MRIDIEMTDSYNGYMNNINVSFSDGELDMVKLLAYERDMELDEYLRYLFTLAWRKSYGKYKGAIVTINKEWLKEYEKNKHQT